MKKKFIDHLGNEFSSIAEAGRFWNLDPRTISRRLSFGVSIEEALKPKKETSLPSCRIPKVDHLGNEFNTVGDMCKFWNINIHTFTTRYKKTRDIKNSLTNSIRESYNNKFKNKDGLYQDHLGNKFSSLQKMCSFHNVAESTFIKRMNHGCTLKDALKHVDSNLESKKKYLNTSKVMKNGQIALITDYKNWKNIDVLLDDGRVINTDMDAFNSGRVYDNNLTGSFSKNEYLIFHHLSKMGFSKISKQQSDEIGMLGKLPDLYAKFLHGSYIIEYDGVEWHKNRTEEDISKNLLYSSLGITVFRIREKGLSTLNSSSQDFILNDNSVGSKNLQETINLILDKISLLEGINFKHVSFDNIDTIFEKANVLFISKKSKKESRIGEKRLNNQGLEMEIISYKNCQNIDVKFTNSGYIAKSMNYHDFKVGKISDRKPLLKSKVILNTGLEVTIIDYVKNKFLVEFHDGYKITVSHNDLYNGNCQHPELSKAKHSKTPVINTKTLECFWSISDVDRKMGTKYNGGGLSRLSGDFTTIKNFVINNKEISLPEEFSFLQFLFLFQEDKGIVDKSNGYIYADKNKIKVGLVK